MSWRWSRVWRTCGRSVCPTWSPLQVRAPTFSHQAARGWSMDLWDAKKASICWWVASFDSGYISCEVPDSSHQNTPLNLTQTQTHPVTRTALPHPLLLHNFTSSSFSPIMPRDSVVSHGKSHHELIELHCLYLPSRKLGMYFWFFRFSLCVRLCAHAGVCACPPARLIPWISYNDEFTQENSVPLQHFLQLQEVVCFVTDERCWEADWGLRDPDPLGCQT